MKRILGTTVAAVVLTVSQAAAATLGFTMTPGATEGGSLWSIGNGNATLEIAITGSETGLLAELDAVSTGPSSTKDKAWVDGVFCDIPIHFDVTMNTRNDTMRIHKFRENASSFFWMLDGLLVDTSSSFLISNPEGRSLTLHKATIVPAPIPATGLLMLGGIGALFWKRRCKEA